MHGIVEPAVFERMVTLRREFHRHPELSWQERRTAERVATALEALGIPWRSVAGTGIVADLPGPSGVPRIALRADMDALPIHEETELPFASEHEGVMHACGHDGHTSILLGAAELLTRDRELPAPVRLVFQPAEEVGAGAQALVQAGVLDDVAAIFGGHIDPRYPRGHLVISDGIVNASSDAFRMTVTGRGAHGARPHEGIDALVAAASIVLQLQTLVSREVNPADPAVLSVGRFNAGTASNVLAARADLGGTIRAHDPAVRDQLIEGLHRVAEATANATRTTALVEITEGTPAVRNTPRMAAMAREAAGRIGDVPVEPLRDANLGGEDFGWYLEDRKSVV